MRRADKANHPQLVKVLNNRLKELVKGTGFGSSFEICYRPERHPELEGEVRGNTIWIYSVTQEHALQALEHEFVDALVVESIKPYQELVNCHRIVLNAILKHVQDSAYDKKEEVIESLLRLMK